MAQTICSIDGCDSRARARGWCTKHYQRWQDHGDPTYERPTLCTIAGCSNPIGTTGGGRGWCGTHYMRWKRTGDPLTGGAVQRQTGTGQPCSVPECIRPVVALDYCERHYRRFKRYGNPTDGGPLIGSLTDEERFWSKVTVTDTCWLWTGAPNGGGYGTFSPTGGPNTMAHRFSYELAGNTLTPGLTIDHLCRVRLCVNPDHLEEVTYDENLRRAREAGDVDLVGSRRTGV
ncbi:MAG: HNH endonuclease [Propionibacteriaceae bacterium]|nr:HNH endonuclease [Propionibacteriaceae bacterium]